MQFLDLRKALDLDVVGAVRSHLEYGLPNGDMAYYPGITRPATLKAVIQARDSKPFYDAFLSGEVAEVQLPGCYSGKAFVTSVTSRQSDIGVELRMTGAPQRNYLQSALEDARLGLATRFQEECNRIGEDMLINGTSRAPKPATGLLHQIASAVKVPYPVLIGEPPQHPNCRCTTGDIVGVALAPCENGVVRVKLHAGAEVMMHGAGHIRQGDLVARHPAGHVVPSAAARGVIRFEDDGFVHGIRRCAEMVFQINYKKERPVKIRNRFYIASPAVTTHSEQGQDNTVDKVHLSTSPLDHSGKWTRKDLKDTIAHAETMLAANAKLEHVAIVKIVKIVRRPKPKFIVEDVK